MPVARVWEEFNGPDGGEDPIEKGYIPVGTTHTNDKGAQAIADLLHELLHELGYEPTTG